MAASLRASPGAQGYLFVAAHQFGEPYAAAVYQTYKAAASDTYVRMQCVDYEVSTWPEEAWTAEAMLRMSKELLEDAQPNRPAGWERVVDYWVGVELPCVWWVPADAQRSRAELLRWVTRVLSNRDHWSYSSKWEKWIE